MRLYVDKGAIRANEELLANRNAFDTLRTDAIKPPFVMEELTEGVVIGENVDPPTLCREVGYAAEITHKGKVVARLVYDPSKGGGNTSAWLEVEDDAEVGVNLDGRPAAIRWGKA
jgi:hypothetical protein